MFLQQIVRSSAYMLGAKFAEVNLIRTSSVAILNSTGEVRHPCGTPQLVNVPYSPKVIRRFW